jgi:hypothetical protein
MKNLVQTFRIGDPTRLDPKDAMTTSMAGPFKPYTMGEMKKLFSIGFNSNKTPKKKKRK